MPAGLSCAVTIPLFLVLSVVHLRPSYLPPAFVGMTPTWVKDNKLELTFAIWCLVSILWSINFESSLIIYAQVFSVIFLGLVLKNSLSDYPLDNKVMIALFLGTACAVILFFVEYFSNGFISTWFRRIFQPNKPTQFYLSMLDRGCALLSLTAWVVINVLVQYRQYLLALVFYTLILILLYMSDSLASFLGFSLAGFTVILSLLLKRLAFKLLTIAIILGSVAMPIFSYMIDFPKISTSPKYSNILPDSAMHRLYIWNSVAKKVLENPVMGIGFASSRDVKPASEQMIIYHNYIYSPLPVHPHNNIMQIWLETGIIGIILFLAAVYKYLSRINIAKPLSFSVISYAAFINYYCIGMISFSIWQMWWVCCGIWIMIMLNWTRTFKET